MRAATRPAMSDLFILQIPQLRSVHERPSPADRPPGPLLVQPPLRRSPAPTGRFAIPHHHPVTRGRGERNNGFLTSWQDWDPVDLLGCIYRART